MKKIRSHLSQRRKRKTKRSRRGVKKTRAGTGDSWAQQRAKLQKKRRLPSKSRTRPLKKVTSRSRTRRTATWMSLVRALTSRQSLSMTGTMGMEEVQSSPQIARPSRQQRTTLRRTIRIHPAPPSTLMEPYFSLSPRITRRARRTRSRVMTYQK